MEPAREPQPARLGGRRGHPVPVAKGRGAEERGDRLVRLSVPNVRKLLLRVVWSALPEADRVLAWSAWRRRHEHRARACHYRKRKAKPPDY